MHYGIPHVYGSQFRRVTLTDPNRFGLLGQGSILTVTSYGNRTSPVVRGKFVLSIFMGNPPPPMPANVPPLNETVDPNKPLSMRQRMDMHRTNPVCANCHRLMDPIGFTLENFDATGKWRTNDGGAAIDPAGTMANGAHVDGPASLRKAIAEPSGTVCAHAHRGADDLCAGPQAGGLRHACRARDRAQVVDGELHARVADPGHRREHAFRDEDEDRPAAAPVSTAATGSTEACGSR